ncbi:Ser/Thr protein phosphatase [Histomonas meleagridis]|uniref:Ser/Thr protein phosphatase n=1 Tax=Histomonas meleagridis TaxID=135588 RepID=UPI00355A0EC5|nr:Ser/Thr protein phosphatase [Histomonas meleagridis]KAH0798234.1 Ser/Thr protein phosphatase [Histomonas meleagridis]
MQLKKFPYVLSQYLWLIVLSLIYISTATFQSVGKTKDFVSKTGYTWNSTKNPIWIAHVTDPHLSHARSDSYGNIYTRMSKLLNVIKPKKIFITGDVTDGSRNYTVPIYTTMVEEDWELYKHLLNELNLSSDKIIYSAGNHDVFDLASIDSDRNYAKDIVYNSSSYEICKYVFEIDGVTFNAIVLNPLQFPAPTEKLEDWAFPPSSLRSSLVTQLKNVNADYTIVSSHYPVYGFYPDISTKSNYIIAEILQNIPNARYFLSGHMHPSRPQIYHHGDTLEIVGMPLFKYTHIGIVTFDNKRSVYHDIDLSQDIFAVITNPPPTSQASSLDVFNEENTEVRVLLFTNQTIQLQASGAVTASLTCKFIEDGVQLCSCPLQVKEGNHNLEITNTEHKITASVSFTVGQTIPKFTETRYSIPASVAYVFLYFILFIITLIITLPINSEKVCEPFDKWIHEQKSDSHWLMATVGGLLQVKYRVSKTPLYIKIALFVSVIWTLFMPTYFFSLDRKVAIMWTWGVCSIGKNVFMFHGMRHNLFYLTFVVIPAILYSSAIQATHVLSPIFILDTIICALFVVGIIINLVSINEFHGIATTLTSPEFVFIPIYMFVALVIYVIKTLKQKTNNDNDYNEQIQDQVLI